LIDNLEKHWIEKTNATKIGYNITEGGTGGDTFSNKSDELKQITRQKLRVYVLKNNPMNDCFVKEKHQNVVNSVEYKQKMSEIVKARGNKYKANLSKGIKAALQNPEIRQKWSDVKKGSLNNRWLGYVIVTDLEGNETKYETAKEAAGKLKVTAHLIREHCRNNTTFQRGIYKGWKFRFDEAK
jgi:hypothetical protein